MILKHRPEIYYIGVPFTREEREQLDLICEKSHYSPRGIILEFMKRWRDTRGMFKGLHWTAPPNPRCEWCGDRPGFTFYHGKWYCRECCEKKHNPVTIQ